jgi:hypothetical protein
MVSLEADHKYFIYDKDTSSKENQNAIFETALRRTLAKLVEARKNVIITFNLPLIEFNIKKCLKRPLIKNDFPCSITEEFARSNYPGYRKVVENAVHDFENEGVQAFDPLPRLCTNGICPLIRDNHLIYIDTNHVSLFGAEWLYGDFR